MEDHEIVDLYWARDERALTETAAKFGAYCRKIALRLLGSAPDAEEVENDTWLAAWNSMPENRPIRLAPYLGRITRNLALDRYDRLHARKRGGVDLVLEELSDALPAAGAVSDRMDAAETARLITEFLRGLPPEPRQIFLRRYWYCDPTRAIARRCGVSEGKVRVTLHRTRQKLRVYLEEKGVRV